MIHIQHSKELRKGRFSQPSGSYFITKHLLRRGFLTLRQRDNICDSLQLFRRRPTLLLHAFVVMPDHWHALFSLVGPRPLSPILHALCRHMSYPTRMRGGSILWQEGFYDHKIRRDDSVADIVRYIERNPVAAGLVERVEDWSWSSAHAGYAKQLDRSFLGYERWA